VGDECPGNGAGDCRFEILCQSATATEHAKVRSTTHLRGKTSKPLRRAERLMISIVHSPMRFKAWRQFISSIATIGKDMAQPGIARTDRSKNAGAPSRS